MDTNSPVNRPQEDRLVGWKDIAAYLKCSVRKAQRLESLNLPVERIDGTKSVWTSRSEIDSWLKSQSKKLHGAGNGTARPPAARIEAVAGNRSPVSNGSGHARAFFSLVRGGLLSLSLAITVGAALRSAYGLTIVLFGATLVLVAVMYRGLPKSGHVRGILALFLTAGMAYSASATTLPEVTGSVVNMMTLRPAIGYPLVSGLRFIPIPALISILLVVLALGRDSRLAESAQLRKAYVLSGLALLLVTAIAGLSISGAHRIWQAGLPIRWTLLAGESFIFLVNVAVFVLGYRFWSARAAKDYGQLLAWCGTGYLLIALTAAIVVRHWNEIDRYYLDIRRPNAYRVQNADAANELRQWLQRHSGQVGQDFLTLSQDAEFLRALRTQAFYRDDFDEPFQLSNKAVIFGYRSSQTFLDKRPFVLIRFPAELAALLRFERAASTP